jgi:hypothetical protein
MMFLRTDERLNEKRWNPVRRGQVRVVEARAGHGAANIATSETETFVVREMAIAAAATIAIPTRNLKSFVSGA